MKRIVLVLSATALSVALSAPRFYTPRMIERRGLTDAQYEYLWSIGRNPHVDQRTARNWFVSSSQNDNFCAWLDTDGKSNELSRLTQRLATNNVALADGNIRLSGENVRLVTTNSVLETACLRLAERVEKALAAYTNQLAKTVSFSNAYVVANAAAKVANAKIEEEIADLEEKIEKYKTYQKKYVIAKSVFAAMITDAENRIKVLRALTGNN